MILCIVGRFPGLGHPCVTAPTSENQFAWDDNYRHSLQILPYSLCIVSYALGLSLRLWEGVEQNWVGSNSNADNLSIPTPFGAVCVGNLLLELLIGWYCNYNLWVVCCQPVVWILLLKLKHSLDFWDHIFLYGIRRNILYAIICLLKCYRNRGFWV